MQQKTYIVEGRSFRTSADYNRAVKDGQIIEALRKKTDFGNDKQLRQLLKELEAGKYRFMTILEQDFREEVEEALEKAGPAESGRGGREKKALEKNRPAVKEKGRGTGSKDLSRDRRTEGMDEGQLAAFVQEELKKREKRRRRFVILCSVLAACCLSYFGLYSWYDYRTARANESLSELKNLPHTWEENGGAPVIHYTSEGKEPPPVLDEYKNLLNKNKKLIGWLKIDDTNINYPVMQTTDNEYYLDHNLNQEYDKNGSIFMDKDCDVLKPSANLILYGHHMKSGQMFGKLDLYSSEAYYKKHRYIQFDTIYERGTYEVMYVFRSQIYKEEEIVFKYYQFIDALSEQEFNSNMREMAAMSLYDTGVTAAYGDRLLTLSTCDYEVDDGRFVVVAKKIEGGEQS